MDLTRHSVIVLLTLSIVNAADDFKTLQSSVKLTVGTLARQMMMQQLFLEERIRSGGDSGIKRVRHYTEGTRPYHSNTFAGDSVVGINDNLSGTARNVYMDQFAAVLNGVDFRTRQNSYSLLMPHRSSKAYNTMENIPFPSVPIEVLQKKTVQEQIVEMRQWFKAWRDGNYKNRDYRNYFKPVLCYLEGGWEVDDSTQDSVVDTWMSEAENIRFLSFSGYSTYKDECFMPTTILDTVDGKQMYAHWNYRIACHPIQRDIPLNRFRVLDDISNRMAYGRTLSEHLNNLGARFQLNPLDKDTWSTERHIRRGLLDQLMEEIPGKNNYAGNLTDNAMFYPVLSITPGNPVLNAARYHRWYSTALRDAMGTSTSHRGYSDENMWAAITSSSNIAHMSYDACRYVKGKKECQRWTQRWTYAIPLEIVYLTPLLKWNPYNLKYYHDDKDVLNGGRNGSTIDPAKAYNGYNNHYLYLTPEDFFSSEPNTNDKTVGVLNQSGELKYVRASGTKIILPSIPGVGKLRTRFPIMPVHHEGRVVMKEVEALKDIIMKQQTYASMMQELPIAGAEPLMNYTADSDGRIGCFIDQSDRHMKGLRVWDSSLTPAKCDAKCRENGFRYFGLQYGKECYCDDVYGRFEKRVDTECKDPCAGDVNKTCGDSWRLEIYQVQPERIGCFVDSSRRHFPHARMDSNSMTPFLCSSHCKDKGYLLAGVEYGGECYCASAFGDYSQQPDKECNKPCRGDTTKPCGGSWRLEIFRSI